MILLAQLGIDDCVRICVASILEINPQRVPNFIDPWPKKGRNQRFWRNLHIYLRNIGYREIIHSGGRSLSMEHIQCHIMPNGARHAVIGKGKEVIYCPIYGKNPDTYRWRKQESIELRKVKDKQC